MWQVWYAKPGFNSRRGPIVDRTDCFPRPQGLFPSRQLLIWILLLTGFRALTSGKLRTQGLFPGCRLAGSLSTHLIWDTIGQTRSTILAPCWLPAGWLTKGRPASCHIFCHCRQLLNSSRKLLEPNPCPNIRTRGTKSKKTVFSGALRTL